MTIDSIVAIVSVIVAVPFVFFAIKENNHAFRELKRKRDKHAAT